MSNRDAWRTSPVALGVIYLSGIAYAFAVIGRATWQFNHDHPVIGTWAIGIGATVLGFMAYSLFLDIKNWLGDKEIASKTVSGWLPSRNQFRILAFFLFLPIFFFGDSAIGEIYLYSVVGILFCILVKFGVLF